MSVVIDGVRYEVPREVESAGAEAIAAWYADLLAALAAPVTPDPE